MNQVRLKIRRQDKPGAGSYWESFEVACTPGINIAAVLAEIRKRPANHHGEAVAPVAWEDACFENCGACTMLINGKPRQACETLLNGLEQPVRLEPLSKFPVVRDLVIDRSSFFQSLERIQAWIEIDGTHDIGPGPRVSAQEQVLLEDLSRCTSCGACLEACPQYGAPSSFMGAAAINQVRLMNANPAGRMSAHSRIDALMEEGGVEDCDNAQNCVKACPAGIPLTESIATMKRAATGRAFKKVFG